MLLGSALLKQNLDCDLGLKRPVASLVYGAHAAAAEDLLDLETVVYQRSYQRIGSGSGRLVFGIVSGCGTERVYRRVPIGSLRLD